MYSEKKIPAPFLEEPRERTPAPLEAMEKCAGRCQKEPRRKVPSCPPRRKNPPAFFAVVLVLLCCCR